MKKWILGGIVSSVLVLGGIGAVWAADATPPATPNGNAPSFEQMLPYMEQMHPGIDKDTFKKMYDACQSNGGPNGMMGGKGASSMMGNFFNGKDL